MSIETLKLFKLDFDTRPVSRTDHQDKVKNAEATHILAKN